MGKIAKFMFLLVISIIIEKLVKKIISKNQKSEMVFKFSTKKTTNGETIEKTFTIDFL